MITYLDFCFFTDMWFKFKTHKNQGLIVFVGQKALDIGQKSCTDDDQFRIRIRDKKPWTSFC